MSNTIESENRSRLTLPASDAADTCAERTIVSPSPASAFFGIGMVRMPSPRTLPPPTPAGGDDSAPKPLATAFARLQVGVKAFFGGRRASGYNVENKKSDVQIVAATVKTHPSSSSLPPAQQHDRLQGDMELVTNGDQGQAGSDDKGPDFDSAMSTAPVVPAVATTEMQEDAEASYAQDTNEADTFDRAVLGLDVSHFSSAAADTPTNYYTPAAAAPAHYKEDVQKPVHNEMEAGDAVALCPHKTNEGVTINGALVELKITAAEPTTGANSTPFLPASSPSITTPASPSTTAILSQDQEVVRNEVAVEATDAHYKEDVQKPVHNEMEAGDTVALCPHKTNEGVTINVALVELKITAAEPTTGANSTPFLPASSPSIATPASPSTTAILSQDQEVVRNEVAVEATDGAQAEETNKNDIVNGAELKAAETDASVTTTVDVLAGAAPSTGIPAFAAPELSPEEVHETVHEEVAKKDSEASDTSGTASSASTWGKKSIARSVWMHFTTGIYGWLAAVSVGLAVGLLLLERN